MTGAIAASRVRVIPFGQGMHTFSLRRRRRSTAPGEALRAGGAWAINPPAPNGAAERRAGGEVLSPPFGGWGGRWSLTHGSAEPSPWAIFPRLLRRLKLHPSMTRSRRTRQGFSFTEVCVAILIFTLCLVPALRALPALMASQTDVETKHLLSLIAQEKLADAVLSLRSSFVERYEYGGLSNPDLRYLIAVTIPAEGAGRYAVVRVLAWVDTGGTHVDDDVPDAGEPLVRFDTIVANCAWSPTP